MSEPEVLTRIEGRVGRIPEALAISLRHHRLAAAATSFADNMRQEYRVAVRMIARHDFQEGVQALLVDKRPPAWSPPDLDGVSAATLDAVFAPLPSDQEWTPLEMETA